VFELAPGDLWLGDLWIEPPPSVRPSLAHRTPWRLLAMLGSPSVSVPAHGVMAD
jgi:hypothetical protein